MIIILIKKKKIQKNIDGKELIHINDIMGEDITKPITLQMINTYIDKFIASKISSKSLGVIKFYAVNTNQGITRDYNEDRISIVINMSKPNYLIPLYLGLKYLFLVFLMVWGK